MEKQKKISLKKKLKASGMLLVSAFSVFFGVKLLKQNNQQAVQLAEESSVRELAKEFGTLDFITKNNQIVRFEVFEKKNIKVVVDDNSKYISKQNIQAIQQSIQDYNNLFKFINPDYVFEYVSAKDLKKSQENDPFIYITANYFVEENKSLANAKTTAPEGKQSNYNNGLVDSHATIILSFMSMSNLNLEQQQAIISHEIAHALAFQGHNNEFTSIMNVGDSKNTIKSAILSQDVMFSLLSLYYNSLTNPNELGQIVEYINSVASQREKEISYGYKIDYANNLNKYIKSKKTKIADSKNLENSTYSYTNMYNQTTILTFKNNTYTLTIKRPNQTIECKGVYVNDGETIVCIGENYTTNGNKLEKVPMDILYVSALTNGDCVFGRASKNCILETTLHKNTLENQQSAD